MFDCNALEQIYNEFNLGAGKGVSQHDYLSKYDFYFDRLKNRKLNILEIGVATGGSLNLWKRYFTNSNIYGIEIDPSVIDDKMVEGCEVFIGSQADKSFLKKVLSKVENSFDIIIDDGSHVPDDQVYTFKHLFKKLNPGGIYVIEDLQTSYREEYRKGEHKSAVDYLKKKIDDIDKDDKMIAGQSFHAGICFIFKKDSRDMGEKSSFHLSSDCHFSSIRLDNINIMGMGSSEELALNEWKQYFRNSDIYYSDAAFFKENVEKIVLGFDIFVDFNGVVSRDIENFKYLFSKLNPGGVYVIDGHRNEETMSFLKDRIDDVNFNGRFNQNNFERVIQKKKKITKFERIFDGIGYYKDIIFVFKRFCK